MSDKEGKKTPLLRFKAYVEAWEKFKLEDVLAVNSGKDYKHLENGEIPVYGTGGYMLSVNDKLSDDDAVGIGRKGTIDKPQLLRAPFWTVDTLFYMTPKRHNNLYYLYALASRINWKMYEESTGVPSLSKQNIEKVVEMFPDSDEQMKIGKVFKQLDNIVGLCQRELELLQLEKQTLISKIFPKEGELIPEIRFKDFTDDWEQRKLSEETTSLDTGKSKFSAKADGQYEILGSTSVIGYDDNYDYVGDFILTARVGANAGELYRHSGNVKISDNTVFIQGENLDFIYYMLMNFDIKKLAFGTGQPLVKASELKETKLMLPRQNRERIQIGEYFRNLDNLITLHQRKIEIVKELRKTLLKYMFI